MGFGRYNPWKLPGGVRSESERDGTIDEAAKAKRAAQGKEGLDTTKRIADLEAENARLRAALEHIASNWSADPREDAHTALHGADAPGAGGPKEEP